MIAGAGGGVAWAVSAAFGGATGLVLGLLCGTAAFLGLALLVGFLPRADAEWLREVLGKRFSGRAGGAVLALAGWRQ
jgi:hypothetical protein